MDKEYDESEHFIDLSNDLEKRRLRWRHLAERGSLVSHDDFVMYKKGDLDKYEAAAFYIRDALHGCKISANIYTQKQLNAAKQSRSKLFIYLFNAICIIQIILPLIEVPMGWECLSSDALTMNSNDGLCTPTSKSLDLFIDHLPTMLGSSIFESFFCAFFFYELWILSQIRDRDTDIKYYRTYDWVLLRFICVTLMMLDILVFISGRIIFAGSSYSLYFFRWSRALTPVIYISYHLYLRLFVKGFAKILPRLFPIGIVGACVVFFYGFVGFIAYHDTRYDSTTLPNLPLFNTLPGSSLATLRLFTSLSFIVDVENFYRNSFGIEWFCLSYDLIAAVCLKSLVTSVSNKLYQIQNQEEYKTVMKRKANALAMAFNCLANNDDLIELKDWIRVMEILRPDMTNKGYEMMFGVGSVQDKQQLNFGKEKCDRAEFYEICALVEAQIGTEEDMISEYKKKRCILSNDVLKKFHRFCEVYLKLKLFNFLRVQPILHDSAVILQAVQLVYRSLDLTIRPEDWLLFLGNSLIIFFWFDCLANLFGKGSEWAKKDWQWILGLFLNVLGSIEAAEFWYYQEKLFLVLMSLRLLKLWRTIHKAMNNYSDVVMRVGLILPQLMRCMCVLLGVVYTFALIAYGVLWPTAVGVALDSSFKTNPMMARFEGDKDILGFGSFTLSLITMMHVFLIGSWTLIMDAASLSQGKLSHIFFFFYRIFMFYFVMPALLGFIVQAWRNMVVPTKKKKNIKNELAIIAKELNGRGSPEKKETMMHRLSVIKAEEEGRVVKVEPVQRAMSTHFWCTEHTLAEKTIVSKSKDIKISELEDKVERLEHELMTKTKMLQNARKNPSHKLFPKIWEKRSANPDIEQKLLNKDDQEENYGSTLKK